MPKQREVRRDDREREGAPEDVPPEDLPSVGSPGIGGGTGGQRDQKRPEPRQVDEIERDD